VDEALNRRVAIKFPHSGQLALPAALDALRDEARRAAELEHVGIVRIHQTYSDEMTRFAIVME
jgi:hypothetical protein